MCMQPKCEHLWEPLPRWQARYRCTHCRVIAWRPKLACGSGSAEITPLKCSWKSRRSEPACHNPATHVRKDVKHRRTHTCDACLLKWEEKQLQKYGYVPDDSTW